MQIILTNPNTGRKWRILPLDSGRCFSIQRSTNAVNQNGQKAKRQWAPVESYPSTLPFALQECVRLMMLDAKDETLLTSDEQTSIVKQCGDIALEIAKFVKGIEVQCK